jgi:hypothetical protein
MEALSQLDVHSPDHVSVITKNGKVTVSVIKDGTSVTLGFPIRDSIGSSTPLSPFQQPAPKLTAVIGSRDNQQPSQETTKRHPKRNFRSWDGPSKLNVQKVREIRMILSDESFRRSCGSITNFYNIVGRKFGVSGCAISNIARGIAWKDVK